MKRRYVPDGTNANNESPREERGTSSRSNRSQRERTTERISYFEGGGPHGHHGNGRTTMRPPPSIHHPSVGLPQPSTTHPVHPHFPVQPIVMPQHDNMHNNRFPYFGLPPQVPPHIPQQQPLTQPHQMGLNHYLPVSSSSAAYRPQQYGALNPAMLSYSHMPNYMEDSKLIGETSSSNSSSSGKKRKTWASELEEEGGAKPFMMEYIEPNCNGFALPDSTKCKKHTLLKTDQESSGVREVGTKAAREVGSFSGHWVCTEPLCNARVRRARTKCKQHTGLKYCSVDGCESKSVTCASGGIIGRCTQHGGGRRCDYQDCQKSALKGGLCSKHGGGKRCSTKNCNATARKGFIVCYRHGGRRVCKQDSCDKLDAGGGYCIRHGGGKRCMFQGCAKSAIRIGLCAKHGGRKRCKIQGCNKSAPRAGFCPKHGDYGLLCKVKICGQYTKSSDRLCARHANGNHDKSTKTENHDKSTKTENHNKSTKTDKKTEKTDKKTEPKKNL